MKQRDRESSPEVRRDLNALDAALRGEQVAGEHHDLATLATELRRDRPQLSPEFAEQLDQLLSVGFVFGADDAENEAPAGTVPPSRVASPFSERLADRLGSISRRLLPLAGVAATAVVVIGIAITQSGAGTDPAPDGFGTPRPVSGLEEGSNPSGSTPEIQGAEAQPASPTIERSSAARSRDDGTLRPFDRTLRRDGTLGQYDKLSVPPIGGHNRLGRGDRVQETSAALTLSSQPDQLQDVADGVISVTDRYDGFVESSNVSAGEQQGRASFTLKIPSSNLQAALADLSDLAHVVSRNEGSADITAPFVSAGERFTDAKAAVARTLERLSEAGTASEIAALREQLAFARSDLASARSQLREIKQRAGLSTVTVAVRSDGNSANGGSGWSIGDAADDAIGVLEALAGAVLVTLAAALPLGLLGALAWFGSAGWRRRRRESGLDT